MKKNYKVEEMFNAKKLGLENAQKVIAAMSKDPQHFGFIGTTAERLAKLTPPEIVTERIPMRDVYFFRAGSWYVLIRLAEGYVEVQLHDPYTPNGEVYTVNDIF